jgi:hypothetical protein
VDQGNTFLVDAVVEESLGKVREATERREFRPEFIVFRVESRLRVTPDGEGFFAVEHDRRVGEGISKEELPADFGVRSGKGLASDRASIGADPVDRSSEKDGLRVAGEVLEAFSQAIRMGTIVRVLADDVTSGRGLETEIERVDEATVFRLGQNVKAAILPGVFREDRRATVAGRVIDRKDLEVVARLPKEAFDALREIGFAVKDRQKHSG